MNIYHGNTCYKVILKMSHNGPNLIHGNCQYYKIM